MPDGADTQPCPPPDPRYGLILSLLGEMLSLAAELDDVALGDRLLDVLRTLPNIEETKHG